MAVVHLSSQWSVSNQNEMCVCVPHMHTWHTYRGHKKLNACYIHLSFWHRSAVLSLTYTVTHNVIYTCYCDTDLQLHHWHSRTVMLSGAYTYHFGTGFLAIEVAHAVTLNVYTYLSDTGLQLSHWHTHRQHSDTRIHHHVVYRCLHFLTRVISTWLRGWKEDDEI